MKQLCVHGAVCPGESCGDCPCSEYLPQYKDLLPVLRRWLKLLDYHSTKTYKRQSLYVDGKAMSVFNIIKYLEGHGYGDKENKKEN